MLTQRLANIVFVIVVIVACIWFAAIAQGFETSGLLASSGLPSKFFPQLTLGLIGLCAVIVGAVYVLRGSTGNDAGQTVFDSVGDARRGLLMLAVASVSYLIWKNFGFIPMAVVIGPLSLLVMGIRSVGIYITVYMLTALVYAVFTRLLDIQLA